MLGTRPSASHADTHDMAHDVFLSYRREDTAVLADSLRQALDARVGSGRVFMDTHGVRLGTPFPQQLRDAVSSATTVVVLIGRQWRGERSIRSLGRPRLFKAADWVREEVRTALRAGKHMVVVEYDGRWLDRWPLPRDLEPLRDYPSVRIDRNRELRPQIDRVVDHVASLLQRREPAMPTVAWSSDTNRRRRLLSTLLVVGCGTTMALGLVGGLRWPRVADETQVPTSALIAWASSAYAAGREEDALGAAVLAHMLDPVRAGPTLSSIMADMDRIIRRISLPRPARDLVVAADGTLAVAGQRFFWLVTPDGVTHAAEPQGIVDHVTLAPDHAHAAAVSSTGRVFVMSRSSSLVQLPLHGAPDRTAAFLADGKARLAIVNHQLGVRIHDLELGMDGPASTTIPGVHCDDAPVAEASTVPVECHVLVDHEGALIAIRDPATDVQRVGQWRPTEAWSEWDITATSAEAWRLDLVSMGLMVVNVAGGGSLRARDGRLERSSAATLPLDTRAVVARWDRADFVAWTPSMAFDANGSRMVEATSPIQDLQLAHDHVVIATEDSDLILHPDGHSWRRLRSEHGKTVVARQATPGHPSRYTAIARGLSLDLLLLAAPLPTVTRAPRASQTPGQTPGRHRVLADGSSSAKIDACDLLLRRKPHDQRTSMEVEHRSEHWSTDLDFILEAAYVTNDCSTLVFAGGRRACVAQRLGGARDAWCVELEDAFQDVAIDETAAVLAVATKDAISVFRRDVLVARLPRTSLNLEGSVVSTMTTLPGSTMLRIDTPTDRYFWTWSAGALQHAACVRLARIPPITLSPDLAFLPILASSSPCHGDDDEDQAPS